MPSIFSKYEPFRKLFRQILYHAHDLQQSKRLKGQALTDSRDMFIADLFSCSENSVKKLWDQKNIVSIPQSKLRLFKTEMDKIKSGFEPKYKTIYERWEKIYDLKIEELKERKKRNTSRPVAKKSAGSKRKKNINQFDDISNEPEVEPDDINSEKTNDDTAIPVNDHFFLKPGSGLPPPLPESYTQNLHPAIKMGLDSSYKLLNDAYKNYRDIILISNYNDEDEYFERDLEKRQKNLCGDYYLYYAPLPFFKIKLFNKFQFADLNIDLTTDEKLIVTFGYKEGNDEVIFQDEVFLFDGEFSCKFSAPKKLGKSILKFDFEIDLDVYFPLPIQYAEDRPFDFLFGEMTQKKEGLINSKSSRRKPVIILRKDFAKKNDRIPNNVLHSLFSYTSNFPF